MSQGPGMRVESLFSTFKELQHEKLCLEQKLHEQKLKRLKLEQDLEQSCSKFAHTQEKHTWMSGTCAAAQQKIDQAMTTALSLQGDMEKNRTNIERLKGSAGTEKSLQQKDVSEFEIALSSISSALISAKNKYKKEFLKSEIAKVEQNLLCMEQSAESLSAEVNHLTGDNQKLDVEITNRKKSNSASETVLHLCCQALEKDARERRDCLDKVREELRSVHTALQAAP